MRPFLQYPISLSATRVLSYGHVPESCVSYVVFGLLLCVDYQEYSLGYEFGQLANQLAEKLQSPIQRCRCALFMLDFIYSWSKSIQELPTLIVSAFDDCKACGEIEYAGYFAAFQVDMLFDQGAYLGKVQRQTVAHLHFAQSAMIKGIIYHNIRANQIIIANLIGETESEADFSYNNISDTEFMSDCQKSPSGMPLCIYSLRKAQVLYLYGDFEQALRYLHLAKDKLACVNGSYLRAVFNWYESLVYIALYPKLSTADQLAYLEQVSQNQHQMQLWSASCSENFEHKYLLVEAECARIKNDYLKAEAYYNQAIELAGQHGFIQEQAIAAELAVKYWLLRGLPLCAQGYLNLTLNGYKQWGAKRKLMQLKTRYTNLLQALAPSDLSRLVVNQETTLSGNTLKLLDLSSILKSSQIISSEIELANLLRSMMQIIIENAGGQRGAVLLVGADEGIIVQAEYASDGTISTLQRKLLIQWTHGAHSIIQFVKKLHLPVIVNDAKTDEHYMTDPYISQNQIKSILCVPILKHTELKAILYVENNLISGAFTSERVQTVQILTGQMAISLENAMLYEAARLLTERLNLSLKSANIGIWSIDLQTNTVTADNRLLALWGIKGEEFEFTYGNFIEIIHPDDQSSIEQAIKLAVEQNIPFDVEFRVVHPDRSIHILASRAETYQNNKDIAVRMVGVSWDITLRRQLEQEHLAALKQAENEARQRAEEAERHRKEQEEFVDTVCHEVRNPMVGIFGHIEFLNQTLRSLKISKENLPVSMHPTIDEPIHQIKESLRAIELCVKHQKTIIDDVLDLSKLEAGKVTLKTIPFQPKQLIEETLQIFTLALNNKHLSLRLLLPERNIIIKDDPAQFKIILMNLISNAIKFTEQGQITIKLMVKDLSPNQVSLELCVQDTGIGMKPEQQANLFQRFSRSASSEYVEGSGLGLVITKNIINLMKGAIEVSSKEGQGSQFKIHLICETEAPQERKTPTVIAKEVTKREERPSMPKSILVVEDNKMNQKILQKYLEQAGYQCIIAYNGLEAVTACEETLFDLILMDREMPVMGGIEATKKIRMREKQLNIAEIPIIGLSAHARPELVDEAKNVGMNDYITKPYSKDILIQKVKQWTSLSIADKELTIPPQTSTFFVRSTAEPSSTTEAPHTLATPKQ